MKECYRPGFRVVVVAVFLCVTVCIQATYACDGCQRPRVVAYDCKVIPERPSDTTDALLSQKLIAWRDLFWASAGIKTYIFNNDPTKECFTHLDGAFFTQGDTATKGIAFGQEWANLPQEDGFAGGEYLVTGKIDGSEGAYTVTAELQVSKTREVVASATAEFAESMGSLDAGKSAGQSLGPIVDKIREFEKQKRAAGDPYALEPTVELHPKKAVVSENEAVEVEIWLYDCDGDIATSPLADRPVQLTATGGKLSASTVTTGSDGKAVVTFTAGTTPAEALLQVVYPFKLASEFGSASGGDASIKITEIPSTLWRVTGRIFKKNDYDEVQRESVPSSIQGYSHQTSFSESNLKVDAVIRNVSHDSLILFQSDTSLLSLKITGSHTEFETSMGYGTMPNYWSRSNTFKTVTCAPRKSTENGQDVSFSFFYSPNSQMKESTRMFSISGWEIHGSYSTFEKECNSEDGCTENTVNDDADDIIDVYVGGIENDTGFDLDSSYIEDAGGDHWTVTEKKYIRKTGNRFTIYSYNFDQVVSSLHGSTSSSDATARTETLYEFVVSPLNSTSNAAAHPDLHFGRRNFAGLNAWLRFQGNRAVIQFNAPEKGVLSVRLYSIQGRLISNNETFVATGSGIQRHSFAGPQVSGIVCAVIVFRSAAKGVYRQSLTVQNMGGVRPYSGKY